MGKLVILFLALSLLFPPSSRAQTPIEISVDAAVVKNDSFYQLLGGYITTDTAAGAYRQDFSNPNFLDAAKAIFPQNPSRPPVMRIFWGLNDNDVKNIITFCKAANCDPMFSFSDNGEMDNATITARIRLVKSECDRVFGDTRHCRHWNLGNEPSRYCYKIQQVASELHRIIPLIREEMPNAVIHALELFYYPVTIAADVEPCKSQCSNYDIGHCIIKFLDQKTPKVRIDVIQTHWYPYIGDTVGADVIDGFAVLSWNGYHRDWRSRRQKMLYPYEVSNTASGILSYTDDYTTSREAVLGMGEISTAALYGTNESLKTNNSTWGAAFWYLDELGILAEAGFKYAQKHIFNGWIAPFPVSFHTFPLIGYRGERLPPSYAYEFYAKYFGNRIVQTFSTTPAVLNAHASLDDNGDLRLILINKSGGQNQTASIRISNYPASGSGQAYVLQVPQGGDFNRKSYNEQASFQTLTNIPVSQTFTYTVPAYTAVILRIPNPNSPPDCQPKNGDTDGDGVDWDDFLTWENQFLAGAGGSASANFDCLDGITLADFGIWRENYH